MLKILRDLGLLLGGRELYDEINADKVIALEFDKEGNFLKAELEEFSSDKLELYLYKKAKGSNPPTLTPTLLLNHKFPSKSIGNMLKSMKKLREINSGIPNLKLTDKKVEDEVNKLKELLSSKETVLLTVKIEGRYLGEISEIVETLKEVLKEEGKDSKGTAVCSVCLQEKEVSGNISPFKFYTIDKPGYITGGFDKSQAYKNFPLCWECKELIEAGRKFVEAKLTFTLAGGIKYYLIPELMFGSEETQEQVFEIFQNAEDKRHKLTDTERKHLTSDEKEILDMLSQEGDYLTMNFLFLEKEQSAERILLHIQDIYPSRLRKLFEIKDYIEKLLTTEGRPFDFTYKTIYKFFSKSDPSKRNRDLKKLFLEIVDKTFRGIPVNKGLLIRFLLSGIRRSLYEDIYSSVIKDAFGVFLFILISTGEEDMKEVQASTLREFVESLPSLDTELKRGLFLMGALTERLLRVQGKERGSTPFMKKLKSLRMNENDLKGLLPDVRNKLEEYDKFGKGEAQLFELASEYLSLTKPKWNMSVEEMNFYFALGMGMFDKLAEFVYRKGEENGDRGHS